MTSSDPVLHAELTGPTIMGVGALGDYMVEITNSSSVPAQNVVIQLEIPSELSCVLLDREAEVDPTGNSLSWLIPEIGAGKDVAIRYRIQSNREGNHHQRINVQIDDLQLGACGFETKVQVNFTTPDAPMLPFEK